MLQALTTNVQAFAVAWIVLAVVWLACTRRYSCWPVGLKDYLWPVIPALLLLAARLLDSPLLPWRLLATTGIALWCFVTLVWLLSVIKRDTSIMDIAYAAASMLVAWTQWTLFGGDTSPRSLLLLAMVNLWGLRYTVYVANRNLPHGEDVRYTRWRTRTGAAWWWWSYFQVFLVQAVMIWLWCIPLQLALLVPGPLRALDVLAAVVWLVGFVFEAGADWQLSRFKRDPANKGKVLTHGLWAQCRHPNYFGEATMWCAYGLLALAHPWGYLGLICTAYTVHMMNRGSATKMTDGYMKKKKPGYLDYAAVTPTFLPRIFGGRP